MDNDKNAAQALADRDSPTTLVFCESPFFGPMRKAICDGSSRPGVLLGIGGRGKQTGGKRAAFAADRACDLI
jgi:hypothetical protein